MNSVTVLLVAGLAFVSCQEEKEAAYGKIPALGKGPYFGGFHGAYGFGGPHPAAVRNDFRQLAVNNVAESVGAGIGTARERGVPGSAIYNYDNVPVDFSAYPAYPFPAFPGFGGYFGAGYGYPYYPAAGAYFNGAATVVNNKPVHYPSVEAVKSVDQPEH